MTVAESAPSAQAAVRAAIERIEQVNPALNAVVVPRFEAALADAAALDAAVAAGAARGPLHGMPITIKECIDLAGTASTFGLPARRDHRAGCDDPHVAALRAAGAVVVGKTNVSQALLYTEADNPVYGRTQNPWNPARSCGGSSGGEGAILAAGGPRLGLGTDIGGSLRTPAAFCGVASLKPTSGRADTRGSGSIPPGQRAIPSQNGILAPRVADVIRASAVILGVGNVLLPAQPLSDPRAVDVARLRVACYADDGTLAPSPAVRRALAETRERLAARGVEVIDWQPPGVAAALRLFFALLSADGGAGVRRLATRRERDPRIADLAFVTGCSRGTLWLLRRTLALFGQRATADFLDAFGHADTDHCWQAVAAQMDYRLRFLDALRDARGAFDLVLCPAAALPAFRHGASRVLGTAGGYAPLWNLLGFPAGVVPVTRVRAGEESDRAPSRDRVPAAAREQERDSAGLPIAVQVAGRPWREHEVLALMQIIEDDAGYR